MAAPEEKEEGAEEQAAPPKKSKKMLIIIIAVVLLVVIGGVLAVVLGGGKKAAEGEGAAGENQPAEQHLMTSRLDPFIVNLSDSSSFLKVTMLLEYDPAVLAKASSHGKQGGSGQGGGGMEGEGKADSGALPPLLKEREPMIKDAIIRVLSSKTAQEVLTVEGKEKLKEELLEAINEAVGLEEAPVVNLYFIEFIVQ